MVHTQNGDTITIYSDNKDNAERAMQYLDDVIWDAPYPDNGRLDDCERQFLATSK